MKVAGTLTAAAVALLGVAGPAFAQEIDYGALTEMFGQPVTTSATGSPQTVSQVPANMQIITADDIRRSGAADIPDILRYVAGIDVRSYGALDSDVSIRGFSQPYNPRLLVLINGRQVYLDDYGYTAWQNLPVQLVDIRQIEIVRGPASALFGFNATSGVINIITYDPLFDKTDVMQLSAGTDGTYQGALVATLQKAGKAGVTLSLGGLKTQEYKTDSTTTTTGTGTGTAPFYTTPHLGNYSIDARGKPTSNTELTLEVTQSQATSIAFDPILEYAHTSYRNNSIKSSIAATTPYGLLTLLAYMNTGKETYDQPATAADYGTNQVGVVQASDLLAIGNDHAVRLGLEYRNNREYGNLTAGGLGYQNYAASGMWNWRIAPNLSFTAAGRIDHLVLQRSDPLSAADQYSAADFQGQAVTAPTYNFGLVYQPTDNDTFRLLTGRAVQAPSLIDYGLDLQIPNGPITVLYAGNPNLKPSISTNYELDYDRALPALASVLRTAGFYNITQDVLAGAINTPAKFNNDVVESYSQNVGHATAFGGEVGIQNAGDTAWRWNLAYSLAAVRGKLSSGPPLAPLSDNNETPVSVIVGGLGYSWQKVEADIDARWQSAYQEFLFAPTPAGVTYTPVNIRNYVTLSARVGYQLSPSLTVAISGSQLAGTQIVETAGIAPERRVLATATFGF